MRIPLIFRISAPIILVVFTITSCNFFEMPTFPQPHHSPPTTIHTVPVGLGDIRIAFLDEDFEPTIYDTGKMAFFVENNKYAEGVLVIAEIPDNNIYNDVVVRIINSQNDSLVSFFYRSGQRFPYRAVLSINGEELTGRFSTYNSLTETFSVEFIDAEGEADIYEDIVLNRNVFSLHKNHEDLTETQNVRLRSIKITLAVWASMAIHFDSIYDEASDNARFLRRALRAVARVFVAVAVVAVVAVVIIVSPPALAIAGPVITAALTTTSATVAAGIAIGAAAIAVFADAIADSIKDEVQGGSHARPPTSPNAPPMVVVYANGQRVNNNQMPPFYLRDIGDYITFNITFNLMGIHNIHDVIDVTDFLYAFCPTLHRRVGFSAENARFFNVDITDTLEITVSRSTEGFLGNGRVQFRIPFRQNVIINDSREGIYFCNICGGPCLYPELEPELERRRNIFVFNFTTRGN